MNITVIGTGYVGLVSGTCLAEVGNHVVCVDIDQSKIDMLNNGEIPIYEPGLEDLVKKNVDAGRLSFSSDIKAGVDYGSILFIAVGTPPDEDGSADLKHVLAVASDIGKHMNDYRVVVTKSTVPVGTADKVRDAVSGAMKEKGASIEFSVVSNPEFLKEGAAVEDFLKPDRIVVGADDDRAIEMMRELYAPFNRNHERIIIMDIRSAEMTKYAANAMLATKISFINEIANVCEALGADVKEVAVGMGYDQRIGALFLDAGLGYGGSCFPKDVKALAYMAAEKGRHPQLLNAVMEINNDRRSLAVNRIKEMLGETHGKTIGLLGLSFKPNTDDMRDAPSIDIAQALLASGAYVRGYDPVAMDAARPLLPDVEMYPDVYSMAEGCDALMVITEWNEFKNLDLERIRNLLNQATILDGRNIYDPEKMAALGFHYRGLGRGYDGRKTENEIEVQAAVG